MAGQATCERDIELNGRRVAYRLTRSKSARKLRARVGLDGVVVVLPAAREEAEAKEFLRANAGWVLAQLEHVETLRRIRRPQLAASGATLYRGEATAVCIVEHPYQRGAAQITHEEGRIVIARAAESPIPAERCLENWLRKQARTAIETELAPVLLRLSVTPNRIYLMEQRTKWGNCSALGNLSFNWRLILAPPFVLRYIVTHEAVHLAIPDHSRRFWLTVQSHCPETERTRQWLCANGHELWRSPLTPAAEVTTRKAV